MQLEALAAVCGCQTEQWLTILEGALEAILGLAASLEAC